MKIKTPVIISSKQGGLFLFETPHDAAGKLDPMRVIKGDYAACDGVGRRLCLLTTKAESEPGYGVRGEDVIKVELVEKLPPDEDEVRKLFVDFFSQQDLGGVINQNASLEDLIKLFVISYGYTR